MSDANVGRYDYLDEDPFGFLEEEQPTAVPQSQISPKIGRLINHLEQGDTYGYLLPIISNSIRTDWILDRDFNMKLGQTEGEIEIKVPDLANIEQQLAQYWANGFRDNYPFGIPTLPKSLRELRQQHPDILDDDRPGNGEFYPFF